MQIHGQKPLGACGRNQISHQFCRNRRTGSDFSVLPGIPVIRHYRGDPVSRCPLHGIDHNQQFHQGNIHRCAGGLNNENIHSANIFINFNSSFPITEGSDVGLTKGYAQFLTYFLRQRNIGVAGKNPDSF